MSLRDTKAVERIRMIRRMKGSPEAIEVTIEDIAAFRGASRSQETIDEDDIDHAHGHRENIGVRRLDIATGRAHLENIEAKNRNIEIDHREESVRKHQREKEPKKSHLCLTRI